jgi:hypothetical protein
MRKRLGLGLNFNLWGVFLCFLCILALFGCLCVFLWICVFFILVLLLIWLLADVGLLP